MKYNIFRWSMVCSPKGIVENSRWNLNQIDLSCQSSLPSPERIKYVMMLLQPPRGVTRGVSILCAKNISVTAIGTFSIGIL